jgi:UDP-3-O-[3-hydroxymyristoyl] glucosamine N-acyltransferase
MQLSQLADLLTLGYQGDGSVDVVKVATLAGAGGGDISFFTNKKYRSQLLSTRASVVIMTAQEAESWSGNALISANPHLSYVYVAQLLHPVVHPPAIIHPKAVIDETARLGEGISVGANAVVEANTVIGKGCVIGSGTVISHHCVLGDDCWIGPNVTILHDCIIGDRVSIESGTVIGSEGFGWAKDGQRWIKVPQLGRVVIGDDVSIGANTCIDRGAIEDTVIEQGVKMDNLIQIAHNVHIGENTAIAGSAGVAGSSRVGARCTIAGKAGISGHLTIADDVHITAMTMISSDIHQAGVYSGAVPQDSNELWRKNAARFRQLDQLAKRIRALEKNQLNDKG